VLGRRSSIGGAVAAWALLAAANAGAQAPPTVVGPYEGQIPFRCQLQNVGTGTAFPDPGADPFCVEFDKTNQNLTDFGLADFTAQEPARVAAAASKCFYFQRDHWTGSVVQGQQPELWHWDGDYWFDRARGLGGVSVRNFRLGGTPQSASPFVPEAYKPYFDEDGGGGVEVLLESNPDPSCGAKVDTPEERDRVYADRGIEPPCIEPGGGVGGRRVGRVELGMTRGRVLARIGPPEDHAKRVDRWCLIGKGELRTAYDMRGRLIAALTSGPGQALHGVSRGDRLQRARRLLDVVDESHVIGVGRVLSIRPAGRSHRVVGARRQRVRWVALLSRALAPGLGLRLSRKVR
jgi:hypothetical protein